MMLSEVSVCLKIREKNWKSNIVLSDYKLPSKCIDMHSIYYGVLRIN